MPANDVTFTADYEAQDVFYSVAYRRMDANGAYTLMYSQNRTAKAGSIVQESCEVSDDYASQVAEGYIKPLVQTVEIAGDGSTVIYYDYRLIKSHLGYDLSGGTATTSNYAQSGDYYYGATLQIPVLSQVKRTGYAAKGWYDASDPSKKLIDGNNITIGAKDVTYKLLWEPVTYTITYDLVHNGSQSLNNPSQYRTGLDFNISAPKCDDMSFVRWEWAGDGAMPAEVKILDNGLVHVTQSAQGDLRFRAVWSEDKLVFSATLYDGSPETYIYYYFGSTLSSIVSYPLTTQGQLSAVGTIISSGYGFVCGAYMPISNFGSGLQKVLSYLPSTYGTSLLKNHMLHGIFAEMENEKLPAEMITAIRDTLDCNPQFHGHVVSTGQMVAIMAGSIVVFGIIFLLVTFLPEKDG